MILLVCMGSGAPSKTDPLPAKNKQTKTEADHVPDRRASSTAPRLHTLGSILHNMVPPHSPQSQTRRAGKSRLAVVWMEKQHKN